MDEALVENAEHDIDGQDRAADQQALVGERSWKVLAVPAKVVEIAGGMPICSSARRCGLRCRQAPRLRQIVRDRHRRKLAELVDGQRAGRAVDAGEGAERNQLPLAAPPGSRQPLGRPVDLRIELMITCSCRPSRRWSKPARCRTRRRAWSAASRLSMPSAAALSRSTTSVRLQRVVLQIAGDVDEKCRSARIASVSFAPMVSAGIQALHDELVLALPRRARRAQVLHRPM